MLFIVFDERNKNQNISQVSLFQTLVTRHSGSPLGSPAMVRRRRREEQMMVNDDKEEQDENNKEAIGILSPLLIRFLEPPCSQSLNF